MGQFCPNAFWPHLEPFCNCVAAFLPFPDSDDEERKNHDVGIHVDNGTSNWWSNQLHSLCSFLHGFLCLDGAHCCTKSSCSKLWQNDCRFVVCKLPPSLYNCMWSTRCCSLSVKKRVART